MRNFILFSFLISFFQITVASETEKFDVPSNYLVSYNLVKSHTTKTISELWKKHHIPKVILKVRNDVDIYEIMYKAKWIDSSYILCSGIYFAPKNIKNAAPIMMYGHGTQIHKHRTISDEDAQQGICLGFATDGYAACYPDYYGIGKGEGDHLYQHAWSEAMSFIYMLYAIDELNKKINVKTNGQLFLTGYSQGGHSSFAAQKYLEELNDPRFQVTASSPMSGAYDMTGEQQKYMFQEYPRPFYLPYLLVSYQTAYRVLNTDNIYSIFKSPFDTLLPKYYSNNIDKTLDDLDKIMPKIPAEVVKDSLVEVYKSDTNFLFKIKLKENNLTDWKPKAPVQLCYCKGDREVNYKNSEVAYNNMTALGVTNIKLNNLSDKLDHNTCAPFAVMATKFYFDRFKNKGENPKMKDVPKFKKALSNIVKKKEEKKYIETGKDGIRY
ncbi:MAG TPA: hypothetical protein PK546_07040 [Chitinophagales bacterium]|jgi:hypothetical protein|nr:hypothetical protein [Chitinophagales bacterium]